MLGENTGTILLAMAMIVVAYVLIRRIYRRTGRSSSQPIVKVPRPDDRQGKELMDAPAEVVRWQVALHDTARDLMGELDSKMSALDFLTRQAAQQATRLEQLIEQARQLGVAPSELESQEITRLAAALRESAARPTSAPADTGTPTPLRPETLRQTIYDLADAGKSPAAIADQIDQPVAEIEQILSERDEA